MDYNKYYEARDIVAGILRKDLLGPLSEEEKINDYPVSFYMVGKLYPQDCRLVMERTSSEDVGETDDEQSIALDEEKVPSSMGMSFVLKREATDIVISAKAALYSAIDELDEVTKKPLWKRQPVELQKQTVSIAKLKAQKKIELWINEELKLLVFLHKTYPDGGMTITATLINMNKQTTRQSRSWVNQHTFFQPEITVEGNVKFFADIRKNIKLNVNKETIEMEMLYSKYRNYVTGHGCAAEYKINGEKITDIEFSLNKDIAIEGKVIIVRRGKKKYTILRIEEA